MTPLEHSIYVCALITRRRRVLFSRTHTLHAGSPGERFSVTPNWLQFNIRRGGSKGGPKLNVAKLMAASAGHSLAYLKSDDCNLFRLPLRLFHTHTLLEEAAWPGYKTPCMRRVSLAHSLADKKNPARPAMYQQADKK